MAVAANGWLKNVRRLVRALRHGPDRLLHASRRQRTAAGLRLRPRVVLFVCYGNICRSPYAEAAFRRLLGNSEVLVQSAGFTGPGREVPDKGQRVALRRGVNLASHRSRELTSAMVQSADLIVVMTAEHQRWVSQRFGRQTGVVLLGDFDPSSIDTRAVIDPVDQPEAVFEAVYGRMDRCLDALARALGPGSGDDEVTLPTSRVGSGPRP